MKKILILLMLLLITGGSVRAQMDYGFNVDTVNSREYLKKIGYLERADVYRDTFIIYVNRALMDKSMSMLFTPYDFGDRKHGVYTVGDTVVYITVDRLKNDTIEFFEHALNVELADIKFAPAVKYFGMSEDMLQAKWEWVVKNMGAKEYKKYFTLKYPKAAAELDSVNKPQK